jgi:uncharacterized membrane protein YjfL (UPF0719 family)
MWQSVGTGALFGIVGIVLLIGGFKLFDLVETKVDFSLEIKNGNVAVAIVVAAFLVAVSFIVGRTIGS